MTKKSTKKIKKALKDLPKLKTSDEFIDKLHDKMDDVKENDLEELYPQWPSKRRWDEVGFDSGNGEPTDYIRQYAGESFNTDIQGNVHVGNGVYAKPMTWYTWMAALWIVLSYPLYSGIFSTVGNDVIEYQVESYGDVLPILIEEPNVIVPVEVPMDTVSIKVIDKDIGELDLKTSSVETIEEWFSDLPFIWEKAETFDEAFSLARSYLGPNETFMWHGNEYHTLYVEEVILYNN